MYVAKKMVRKQTLRPSGRYAGLFNNKYLKCFNMVIKVAESAEEDATELSKLVFMLSRLIFFQVRTGGGVDVRQSTTYLIINKADMFLRGEWDQLYDQFVQGENRVRGGRGGGGSHWRASGYKRAIELMEEGLVGQSVTMLGESRILDVGREGVMDQLKAQFVRLLFLIRAIFFCVLMLY